MKIDHYQDTPYHNDAHPMATPERLAVLATLQGQAYPAPQHCKVLEVACAVGGHLIPLAQRYPHSQFTGVDLSTTQISTAQTLAQRLNLSNIELIATDFQQLPADYKDFDYILVHGLYSWLPKSLQKTLIDFCYQRLSPQGYAYISYNCFPGWHLKQHIRNMVNQHCRDITDPQLKRQQAKWFLSFLASEATEKNLYQKSLKAECDNFLNSEDYYLTHELLAGENNPQYFHQFMQDNLLYYFGDGDFRFMSDADISIHAQDQLAAVSDYQQHLDYFRNRMFRCSWLSKTSTSASIDINNLKNLYFSCQTIKNQQPLAETIHEHWPSNISYQQLITNTSISEQQLQQQLAKLLFRGDIHSQLYPIQFKLDLASPPKVSSLTREQIKLFQKVSNPYHQTITINEPLLKYLIQQLDGQRDFQQLTRMLSGYAEKNNLFVGDIDQQIKVVMNELQQCGLLI